MKKRLLSTSLIFFLCALMLIGCSCLSSEQQQIAKENESVSKTIAEEYLKSNYKGGTVNNLSCITYTPKESVIGSQKASSYVRASATANDKDFYILIDTESKECLDNYNEDDVKEIISQRAAAVLPNSQAVDITAKIYPKSVSDDLRDKDYEGYLNSEDKTADDIFKSGNYSIDVICSYINDSADFSAISPESFLPDGSKMGSVTLSFLNYRDEARYHSGGEDSYKLKDSFVATYSDGAQNPISEYHAYSSFKNDDVEIAWDSTKIDVNISEGSNKAEEQIYHEDYQDLVFTPKNENLLNIDYTLLEASQGNGELYFYFDGNNYGDYGILTDNQNTYSPNSIFEINGSKSGYTYYPFSFSHNNGKFSLAIYKGEKSSYLSGIVNGFGEPK